MLVALLFVVALADPALAAGFPPSDPPVATRPDWRRRQTFGEMMAHYPKAALAESVEGEVVLRCAITPKGRAEACAVVSETPTGYGFGAAAIEMSKRFEFQPGTVNGAAVRTEDVRVPIAFTDGMSKAPRPGLDGTLACYGLLTAHAKANPKDRLARDAVVTAQRWARNLFAFTPANESEILARLEQARLLGATAYGEGADPYACFLHFGD